jgi:hypothetical protein
MGGPVTPKHSEIMANYQALARCEVRGSEGQRFVALLPDGFYLTKPDGPALVVVARNTCYKSGALLHAGHEKQDPRTVTCVFDDQHERMLHAWSSATRPEGRTACNCTLNQGFFVLVFIPFIPFIPVNPAFKAFLQG